MPEVLKTHRLNTTQSHLLQGILRENERLTHRRDQLKAELRRKRALAKDNMGCMIANQEELGRLLNGQKTGLRRKLVEECRMVVSGIPDTIGRFTFTPHFDEASNPQLHKLGDSIRTEEFRLKSTVAEREESAQKSYYEVQTLGTTIASVQKSRVPDIRDIMKMRRVLSASKATID